MKSTFEPNNKEVETVLKPLNVKCHISIKDNRSNQETDLLAAISSEVIQVNASLESNKKILGSVDLNPTITDRSSVMSTTVQEDNISTKTTETMHNELDIINNATMEAKNDKINEYGKTADGVSVSGHLSKTTSQSMTSLPPDDQHEESRANLKAKLIIERPYNSLTVRITFFPQCNKYI